MFFVVDVFFYLEMGTRDTFSNLLEERLLDLDELGGLDHVQNLLDLAQKHHLDNAQLDVCRLCAR